MRKLKVDGCRSMIEITWKLRCGFELQPVCDTPDDSVLPVDADERDGTRHLRERYRVSEGGVSVYTRSLGSPLVSLCTVTSQVAVRQLALSSEYA